MVIQFAPVRDKLDSAVEKITIIGLLVLLWLSLPQVVYANDNLTDIFATKAFQGSWEVINKFNWVGYILNFVISAVSILGLCSIMYQRMVSLLYLSSRNFFDTVYEVKQEAKGTQFFGFKGLADNVYRGNVGVGFDSIVGIFYSLIPNIKAYSDFNPDRLQHGLKEDDNVVTYMLKTLLPTVLLIFFFAIGFNGTLAKSYGVIVNGFSAAADRVVDVNLEGVVNRVFNAGEKYTFTLGANNTPEGKLAEDIARDIYGKVLSRLNIVDTQTRLIVGEKVESWVWQNILGGSWTDARGRLASLAEAPLSGVTPILVETDSDVKALTYDITVNTDNNLINSGGNLPSRGRAASASSLMYDFLGDNVTVVEGNTVAEKLTVHIVIRKNKVSEANFFRVNDSSSQ